MTFPFEEQFAFFLKGGRGGKKNVTSAGDVFLTNFGQVFSSENYFFQDFARVCHFCGFWQVFRLKIIFSKILLGFVIFAAFVRIFRLKTIFSKILLGFVIFVVLVGFFV